MKATWQCPQLACTLLGCMPLVWCPKGRQQRRLELVVYMTLLDRLALLLMTTFATSPAAS